MPLVRLSFQGCLLLSYANWRYRERACVKRNSDEGKIRKSDTGDAPLFLNVVIALILITHEIIFSLYWQRGNSW